jgi:hypothetical protein
LFSLLLSLLLDIALMQFFVAADDPADFPVRDTLDPRTDDVNTRSCRTIGRFALYMHDYGLDKFDEAFRGDVACWNASATSPGQLLAACSNSSMNRAYTWWCNKRPGNPCVFNCPNQVCVRGGGGCWEGGREGGREGGPFTW